MNYAVFVLEALDCVAQQVCQQLGIHRTCYNSAVHTRAFVFWVILSEVEDELECVVTHLKVVGIARLKMLRLGPGVIAALR